MFICWILYDIQSYSTFKEIKIFSTIDTSLIIRILEFTNYRAQNLSMLLIEYFVLLSVNLTLILILFKPKNKLTKILIGINVLVIAITWFITNIFISVYLLLTLLSILVIMASFFISHTLWGSSIKFDKDDIIYQSKGFNNQEGAETSLQKFFKSISEKNKSQIKGDIFENDNLFYFEIYAKEKIILNDKGVLNFDE